MCLPPCWFSHRKWPTSTSTSTIYGLTRITSNIENTHGSVNALFRFDQLDNERGGYTIKSLLRRAPTSGGATSNALETQTVLLLPTRFGAHARAHAHTHTLAHTHTHTHTHMHTITHTHTHLHTHSRTHASPGNNYNGS